MARCAHNAGRTRPPSEFVVQHGSVLDVYTFFNSNKFAAACVSIFPASVSSEPHHE